jgi:hypothetical protein
VGTVGRLSAQNIISAPNTNPLERRLQVDVDPGCLVLM